MGASHAKEQELRTLAAAQENTHFTLAEVKHLREHYLAVAPSGETITRDAFGALVAELHLPGLSASLEVLDAVFSLFDLTGSDLVDFKSLLSALSICARGTLSERITLAYGMFADGSDESGSITRESMSRMLTLLLPLLAAAEPSGADAGASSGDELPTEATMAAFVDSVFDECDVNADGLLDLAEFSTAAEQHPMLIRFLSTLVSPDTSPNRARRYLVAVDSGASCHRAFQHTLADLRGRDHALHLVAVTRKVDARHKPPLMSKAKFEASFIERQEAIQRTLDTFTALAEEAGITSVTPHLIADATDVGPAIVGLASEVDADVLVMGFEGEFGDRHSSAEVHLGDVARWCIDHAHCSVLIIK